jgi:ribosomal protein L29
MRYNSLSPGDPKKLYKGQAPATLSDEELEAEIARLKKQQLKSKYVQPVNILKIRVLQQEIARRSQAAAA